MEEVRSVGSYIGNTVTETIIDTTTQTEMYRDNMYILDFSLVISSVCREDVELRFALS